MARFEPPAVIAALPRATMFMGVPTLYVRRLAAPSLTRAALQEVGHFKGPKHCFNVQELPRNTLGKVQQKRLRVQYADLFPSCASPWVRFFCYLKESY